MEGPPKGLVTVVYICSAIILLGVIAFTIFVTKLYYSL